VVATAFHLPTAKSGRGDRVSAPDSRLVDAQQLRLRQFIISAIGPQRSLFSRAVALDADATAV
jgi:hypothetical protein